MKFYPILFLFLLSTSIYAQDTEHPKSSPVPNVFNLPRQFFFIDFTQTNWLNTPEGIESKYISGGWNINFLYEINLIPARLGIAPGLSYVVTGVKNNAIHNYVYDDHDNVIYTELEPKVDSIIPKSKLSTSYFEIPLEIHLHSNSSGARNKSFMVAPGFRVGVLVGDYWKLNFENASLSKAKFYDIAGLSTFRYGVSLRLMWYKFGLFGYYQLNDLFEKDKGPAITPLSFGITVSPF